MMEDVVATCSNCYFESFDSMMYPCSRCIRNMPKADMWKPKVEWYLKDELQIKEGESDEDILHMQ